MSLGSASILSRRARADLKSRLTSRACSTFWLALDYDLMLVRFQQIEADGDGFELFLREAEFNGEKL